MISPDILRVLLYDKPIGTLAHLSGDKNLFTFDEAYINESSRPILSLSFKDFAGDLITEIKMTRTRLPPFFSNLLPESPLREYLAKRAHINPQHEFFLLWALGQDLPGAVTIQPTNHDTWPEQQEVMKWKTENQKELPLRFSLAGIQLKFSAVETKGHGLTIPANGVGGGWIVKLPHAEFPGVPENEYTMMELARKIGIDVPETKLLPIEKIHRLPSELQRQGSYVFAIKRFDRMPNGDRIHVEDFAQVFRIYPEKKYSTGNYRNIAEVVWKEVGEVGVVEFIRRFVFNALIGNGDMHHKNWSLIYRERNRVELAPAYDFVSTIFYLPEDHLALNFVDSKDFESLTLAQFKRFAAKAQISEQLVLDTVQETVEAFSKAWKTVKDLPLKKEARAAIEKHLQRIPLY
jgi:serine/threonine-protein kinase HipA